MNQPVMRARPPALSLALAALAMAASASSGAATAGASATAAPAAATPAGATAAGVTPKKSAAAQSGAPTSEDDKLLYELGVLLSGNLDNFNLSEAEFKWVYAGIADSYHHRADATQAMSYAPKVQALLRSRVQATSQHNKEIGQAFLAKQAATPGARKTPSGLVYIPVDEGTGASPTTHDQVKVNYEGKLVDGTVFDSSASRGQPATLNLGNVIPCFTESLQLMKVGGKGRIICPADLAYGDRGASPKIKPGETLEFDVELLEIMPLPAASQLPAPGAAPPGSALPPPAMPAPAAAASPAH
jgi:FKBP-type peptidyl-prolyl cis-trans isomerase